jgi:hypothetical protein
MNKLSRFQFNPNWHLEEIKSFEELMQVKKLVLGNAKKTINIVATKNEEVIATERRCNITLEDFRNVHAIVSQQLAMAKKQLEITLQSTILAYVQTNLKNFEGSSCENTNNIQVHSKPNMAQCGSSMVLQVFFKPN